jgi:LuxR family maltose regulon positive regulatory protein
VKQAEPGARLRTLSSKLAPPALPTTTITRAGSALRLDGARRVALVVAPAGYGKTVAARQWYDQAAGSAGWLSVDLIDASPSSFWLHMLAALRRVAVPLDEEVDLLLEERGPDAVFLAELITQLERSERVVDLVLDDLGRVESDEVFEGLALLVERVGDRVRVIATSRAELPLPVAAWRGRDWVVDLREDQLRLDDDDAHALARAHGFASPAESDVVTTLNQKLEGWPIAVHLALRSMTTTSLASLDSSISDTRKVLANDFVGQVLERLTDDQRDVALGLSVLRWFDLDLCRELLGEPSVAILRGLDRQQLFLQGIDEPRRAMRYHSLVRGILEEELRWRDPQRHEQLHRDAAELWLAREDLPAAYHHLLEVGEGRSAFDLVIQPALELVDRGDRAGLARLVASLPRSADVADPALALDLAVVAFFARRRHDAARWCDHAGADLPSDDPSIGARLHAMRALLSVMDGDIDTAAGHIALFETLAHRTAATTDPVVRWFSVVKARVALVRGEHERARDAIEEVASLTEPETVVKVTAPALEAWFHLDHGRLKQASALADQAAGWAYSASVQLHHGALEAFVVAGWCRLGAGDLPTAAELADTARDHAEALGYPWDLARACALFAEASRLSGEPHAAVEAVRDLRSELDRPPAGAIAALLDTAEAAALLTTGRVDNAGAIRDRLPDGVASRLLGARIALAGDQPQRARRLLADRQVWPTHRRLEAELLLAATGGATHHEDLAHALRVGGETGWVSPFLGHGEQIEAVVSRAPVERLHPALAHALASWRDHREPQPASLVDPLTQRELDVLAFLPTHLSYAQIGARMYLSVNTIKTTLKSVYRKLGASSRAQAVDAARRAGLL